MRKKKSLSVKGFVLASAMGLGIGYLVAKQNDSDKERNRQETLMEMIQRHEGRRSLVYKDHLGNRTIGVGFNLERKDAKTKIENLGLSYNSVLNGSQRLLKSQIDSLLREDIESARNDAINYLGREDFEELDSNARKALIDMAFNLGYHRLNGFKKLRKALQVEDYHLAAEEMINSGWYGQVGNRSKELVEIMRNARR